MGSSSPPPSPAATSPMSLTSVITSPSPPAGRPPSCERNRPIAVRPILGRSSASAARGADPPWG
eukprot:11773318-Heterocapsa_arctica.AAC.2